MNIAIINQSGGKYLFEVPESITLKEGEKVKCDTRRGVTDGIVWADSIVADEPTAKLIGKLLGANFPLKSVVGKTVTSIEMFEQPEQPKQEPVKLYCVKDPEVFWVKGSLTKGKVYEFNGHRIKYDCGTSARFNDLEDWKRGDPNYAACLVPLVSRPAKVGEWVLITADSVDGTQKNEICEVLSLNEYGSNKPYLRTKKPTIYGTPEVEPCTLANHNQYLVLDGYKPEPEYYSGKVVCIASSGGFTVGKIYEFKNGVMVDDDGDVRPNIGDQKITSLSDAFLRDWENKFIEFKGE